VSKDTRHFKTRDSTLGHEAKSFGPPTSRSKLGAVPLNHFAFGVLVP